MFCGLFQLKIPRSAPLETARLLYLQAQPLGSTVSGTDNTLLVR